MQVERYIDKSVELMTQAIEHAEPQIKELAAYISQIMMDNGVIQLYGVEHDVAYSMELGFRAGGLVQYHQMALSDLTLRGHVDAQEANQEGYLDQEGLAQKLWDAYRTEKEDAIMMYVTRNVYRVTLDVAKIAKARGQKVIVISTEKALLDSDYRDNAEELLELADVRMNLDIPYPDLILDIDGVKTGQVANLVGNMIAQTLTMEIYDYLITNGQNAPVLWSANIVGADEHNKNITGPFEGRWNA